MTPTPVSELEARLAAFHERAQRLSAELAHTFLGQAEVTELLLLTLLADGHALIEGAPGLGKTTLVKGLAAALDLSFQRIQFTPDLMPADILGTRILEETAGGGHAFRFEPGPIFANLVLADEVNRATPRTQSAMLEAMQEGQVTAFGETRILQQPFCVVATQNPIEMEGTYPLPEAQLDRFLCKLELRPPGERDLIAILEATTRTRSPARRAVLGSRDILEMRALVREVPIASELLRCVARLVQATDPANPLSSERLKPLVRYGSSPRGGQALVLLAKARALVNGRPWVTEEDLELLCLPALRHRLVLSYEGEASGVPPDELVREAWLRGST
ncbi:MAG: AAA family ATPase [Planctomycetes bacterium]|nr:AAA family ATPase [Planctomycetota bacterium]